MNSKTKLMLIISLLFTSLSSYGIRNPQIRACAVAQGVFLAVYAPEDQIGLCRLGLSLVGSIDLLNKDAQIEIPLSLHNYKKGVQVCTNRNLATLITFEGEQINVCYYSDGSVIDIETLSSGKSNERNNKLNRALKLWDNFVAKNNFFFHQYGSRLRNQTGFDFEKN